MRALPWRPLPRETTHGPRRDGGTFTTSYDPGAALGDPGNIVTEPISLDPGHTRIVVRMLGWGEGDDWDRAYAYFARGNAYYVRMLEGG